jgi:hypothetical protein
LYSVGKTCSIDLWVESPAVGDIVVDEPVANPEAEAGHSDLPRVVTETRSATVGDAVLDTVDHETVQVRIGPAL